MKIQKLFITMAAALAVAATSARAEDAPASQGATMAEAGHTKHSDTVAGSAGKGGFIFTGYIDALAGYSTASKNFQGGTRVGNPFLAGSTGALNLMTSGTRPGCSGAAICRDNDFTFLGGEVLMQMKKDFGGKGIAAATLSFAETGTNGAGNGLYGAGNELNSTQFALTVEELYAGINLANNVNFYLGRYIAPIGIESVQSNARKTITMSNLFAGALPFYYTGAMLAYEPTEGPFAKAMIFNDWLGSNVDGGVDKGYSLLVGYTGNGAYVGLTWVGDLATRPNPLAPVGVGPRNSDWMNLLNLDLTYTKDKLFVGFEGTYRLINTPGNDAQWIGLEGIASFKATDAVEVGARLEYNYYDPQQAYALAVDPSLGAGLAPAGSFKGIGFTPFVIYTVTDGLFVRGEYRFDSENPLAGSKGGTRFGYQHFLGLNVNATF